MSLDETVPSYVVAAIVVYYTLLFALSSLPRRPPADSGRRPCYVILVPARNEKLVISDTVGRLVALQYDGIHRILVLDDASSDGTGEAAHAWARRDARVRVVVRGPEVGGRGKSDVLNHGYRLVDRWTAERDPWLFGAIADDVVVGIVDADGQLEANCLASVAHRFHDPDVATVQVGVRIANASPSLLARMQDMEFVAFTWLVQIARDRLGSSGLGGNGQFTRLAALRSLGPTPWSTGALTEDLDLGLRLVERGWRTRFCQETYVEQQGLESWRPLLRQRTRWIQGHYQCWRHIPKLVGARGISWVTRADLVVYLVLVVTVMLVTGNLVVAVLATTHVLRVTDHFLQGIVPFGMPYRAVSLVLSVLPLATFMTAYQIHSPHRFRWYAVPAGAMLFTLYTYVWAFATLRAWARIATRRTGWAKTPRVAIDAHGEERHLRREMDATAGPSPDDRGRRQKPPAYGDIAGQPTLPESMLATRASARWISSVRNPSILPSLVVTKYAPPCSPESRSRRP